MTDAPLLPSPAPDVLPPALIAPTGPEAVMRAYLDRFGENTREAYRRDIMVFARFLAEWGVIAPVGKVYDEAEATRAATWLLRRTQGDANQVALAYRNWMAAQHGPDGRPLAGATVDRRLAALKSLVRCGRLIGVIPWTIEVQGLGKKGTTKTRDTRGPGVDGVRLMKAVLEERNQRALRLNAVHPHRKHEAKLLFMAVLRDRAILYLLYVLALRCFEVAGLTAGDVNFSGKRLTVRRKGGNGQVKHLTIPDKMIPILHQWWKVRRPKKNGDPLFVSLNNLQVGSSFLTDKSIYRMIKNLGEEAGLKTWPHGLRHAGITEGLEATGGDVRSVAKYSGHARVETVMTYDDERRDMQGNIANQVADRL